MAILPFDLSLITIRISDWRQFSDIHISQSSVATCLRRGGIFKPKFVVNLLPSPAIKMFENRLIFGEVMGKGLVSCFFIYSRCISASTISVGNCNALAAEDARYLEIPFITRLIGKMKA